MEEARDRPSPLATLGTTVILLAILVVAVYGLTHASITVLNPEQKAPEKHFASMKCGLCHTVSKDAPLVEPD